MGQKPDRMPPEVAPFRAPIDIDIPCTDITEIETMLYQFGFLHDFPAGTFTQKSIQEAKIAHRVHDYVHISGIALVRVVPGKESSTILWVSNPFLGSKKWHPKIYLPSSKGEEKFCQSSFEDLLHRFKEHRKVYFGIEDADPTVDPLAVF
eukprot:sb/3473588/